MVEEKDKEKVEFAKELALEGFGSFDVKCELEAKFNFKRDSKATQVALRGFEKALREKE